MPSMIWLRERGVIKSVSLEENHGWDTVWVHLTFPGSDQGFGGLALDRADPEPSDEKTHRRDSYLRSLCDTFDVKRAEDLVGLKCLAMRLELWGTIEGLEAPSGKRFLHYDWRIQQLGKAQTTNPLKDRIESAKGTMTWAQRRLDDVRRDLEKLEKLTWPPVDGLIEGD